MHLLCNVRRGEVYNNSLLLHNRWLDPLHEDVGHELGHKISVEKDVHKPWAGNFMVVNDFRGGQTSQYRLGHLAGWEGLTLCLQGLGGGEGQGGGARGRGKGEEGREIHKASKAMAERSLHITSDCY